MNYKLIILAPSCGGKSTLTRYLREHTNLEIAETDELIMEANNGVWPNDHLKNDILVPKTTKEVIKKDSIIYFASYIPPELLREAKNNNFKVIVLDLALDELRSRNEKRMKEEGYKDVSTWFRGQLDNFRDLSSKGLVDIIIDGNRNTQSLVADILNLDTAIF